MATAAHRKTRRRRWLLLLIPSVDAANWAQTTGALRQNLAVPYMATPSKNRSHWSGRLGHATAVSNEACMATRACAAETVCMYERKCKKTGSETVADSAQLCRVDGDCAGGDSEECVDIAVQGSDPVCSRDRCCKVIHDNRYHLYLVGGDDFSATFTKANRRKQHDAGNPSHGFRNDVWRLRAKPRTWLGMYDMIDRTRYDHKMPKLWSLLRWEQRAPGRVPDSGETYEEFIQCQLPLQQWSEGKTSDKYPSHVTAGIDCQSRKWFTRMPRQTWFGKKGEVEIDGMYRGWFSPRRFHQLAEHKGNLFLIGGRAREHKRLANDRTVGLTSPKQMQMRGRAGHSTWREPAVLKNDVWLSGDGGANWRLIEPGCQNNKALPGLLLTGGDGKTYVSDKSNVCKVDTDCYSPSEECTGVDKSRDESTGICTCKIWSPREQHRVAIHRGIMFLVGGFVTVHRSYCEGDACGDVDAGGYREYLSDVWYWDLNTWLSEGDDGQKNTWEENTIGTGFAGRGGHSLSVLEMLPKDGLGVQAKGIFALWVIGGRTGSADDKSRDAVLDDAWYAEVPMHPCPVGTIPPDGLDECVDVGAGTWEWLNACPDGCGFPARSGHATVVDLPSESNLFTQRVYVIGGEGQDGSLLGDVWSTGWECTHDGQQAGSRTKVPTAAATDTVNEPSRGVWRGFCTSKICLEGKCEAGDPNNDINLVKTELQDGLDQDNKYCFTRKCKKTDALTVANSAQLCRVDSDCAGGDNEECVDITWTEDDEQRYVACVAEDDCPAMATCRAKPRWRRDYDPDALFRAKVPGGAFMPESTFVEDVEGAVTGNEGEYYSKCDADPIGAWFYDAGAPQQHYVDGDSPVEKLVKVYLPTAETEPSHAGDQGYPSVYQQCQNHYGIVPRRKQLITDGTDGTQDRLGMLHTLGIHTIRDLAEATREQIVELRGYRNPGATPLVDDVYEDVCDHKAFAEALLDKCHVTPHQHPLTHFDLETFAPWNVEVEFAPGSPPLGAKPRGFEDDDERAFGKDAVLDGEASGSLKEEDKLKTWAVGSPFKARWHCGRDQYPCQNPRPAVPAEEIIAGWDGCKTILGGGTVDVPGIGGVPPPDDVKDPEPLVRELICKQNPGPRAYHTGVFFDGKVYVLGGLENKTSLKTAQDMWYRDDNLPRAELGDRVPAKADLSTITTMFDVPQYQFHAKAADEAVMFEYLVYDADENQVVRTWDRSLGKAQVNWLDKYYENGPGSGFYIFYVRAVDAAGNVDVVFDGLRFRNMYKWKYNTRLPWDYIGYSVLSFLTCVLVAYKEYQRRKRKAAMERYAIKRMRRKFKGAQKEMNKGGVDWRKMMDDDKKKRKKKDKKKGSEKKKAKDREKQKAKKAKQKEKEKLKKKRE